MADQSQQDINPFVQQYGQVRLVPMKTPVSSTQQAIEGSQPAGGPAATPTGNNPKNAPPGTTPPAKPKVQPGGSGGDGGNVLPYIVGAGAAAAGGYALKRYLDSRGAKPQVGAPVQPTDVPFAPVSGNVPDGVVRPQWRYVTPDVSGVPAVVPPRGVVPHTPYVDPKIANPAAIEAVAKLLK